MNYPVVIQSLRFGNDVALKAAGGRVSKSLEAGGDHTGAQVHIERHELDTFIYRERRNEDGTARPGDYELVDILPNTAILVATPAAGCLLKPSYPARGAKDETPAVMAASAATPSNKIFPKQSK